MNVRNQALLVIGILIFIKGTLAMVRPDSFRKLTDWWLRTVRHINTLTAFLCMVIGLVIFSMVLFQQPMVNWMLAIIGVLLFYGGVLYLRMSEIERIARTLVLKRGSPTIRLIGALLTVLAAWIIWVAIAG